MGAIHRWKRDTLQRNKQPSANSEKGKRRGRRDRPYKPKWQRKEKLLVNAPKSGQFYPHYRMQAQMDHLQASMPHSTPCPGSGSSTKANWSDSQRSHALSLHSSLSLSLSLSTHTRPWIQNHVNEKSRIPVVMACELLHQTERHPRRTVVLGAHGMHRFTHFYLHFCAPLSRWFMHLWESKGLELSWVFFNFRQLTYTNAAQKLIVKWNFGFTLQFCLM